MSTALPPVPRTPAPYPAAPHPPAPPTRPADAPAPLERRAPEAAARPGRDVPLDLLRGLAMVILVVNHTRLDSVLSRSVGAVISAAEVLVLVSGVVVGMVFGRRFRQDARATTVQLLLRARKLLIASIAVVALTGALTVVPGLATDALTVLPDTSPPVDLYAFAGPLRMLLAVVTLEAGPWQFDVLGLFIALLALTPALLWATARGWWPALLAVSWAAYLVGRSTGLEVLPSLSERVFPLLVWQVLFVHGLVLGWHREAVEARLQQAPRYLLAGLVLVALSSAVVRVGGPYLPDAVGWEAWKAEHFSKRWLDPLRLLAMTSMAAAAYLALRRLERPATRVLGALLLPLGRHSLYVFIVHVPLVLAVASVPLLARPGGLGLLGNTVVQAGALALLCLMVRRRFLFRWIPS